MPFHEVLTLSSSPEVSSPMVPIGVFDSGAGGLSVLRAIRQTLPSHPLLYVADTAHAPYGDRSTAFIQDRTARVAAFLVQQGAQALVVACNTASAHASQALRATYSLPVVAIEPAIKPAAALTKTGVVGVLATSQTLASANVANLCAAYGQGRQLLLQACPGLADQVDKGELDSPATQDLLAKYLAPLQASGADVVVLGCTHYPFLRSRIQSMMGPDVLLVDPAEAVARELCRRLSVSTQRAGRPASVRFFASGNRTTAQTVLNALWHAPQNV